CVRISPPTTATLLRCLIPLLFFFFTHPPTTEIYTLSLHDALPISEDKQPEQQAQEQDWTCPMHPEISTPTAGSCPKCGMALMLRDRKSTRLNSSHLGISYAVFCLKKKKKNTNKIKKKTK